MVSKFVLLCFVALSFASTHEETLGVTDGPWAILGLTGYSGMISMNALTGSSLFYWLFESIGGNITTDSRPLILWLQGGPGCSGELGMLFENISPLTVYSDHADVYETDTNYTWATDYHIMTVDFPYGAGFSYANVETDNKNTTLTATYYLYRMLAKLQAKYPSWFNRPFYVMGESYGGHWVPGLAYNILQQNLNNPANPIRLQGIALGDPWVDPLTQTQSYAKYAFATSLINYNQYNIISYYQGQVLQNLNAGMALQAEANWENSYSTIVNFADNINYYNVRNFDQYNFNYIAAWLNKASVKSTLNVPSYSYWVGCNDTMYDYYRADIMTSTIPQIAYVLSSGLKVLIYNGQDDLIVNTPGIEGMIDSLNVDGFSSAKKVNWNVEGELAGYAQNAGNFTFVVILKSGHMAPLDQPVNAKDMINRFVNNLPWTN